MDYEKAYKDALERARNLHKDAIDMEDSLRAKMAEIIFSELKESEDKQSKKWILEYLYDGLRNSDEQFKGQFKAAIAWLEKQGKVKHTCRNCKTFQDLHQNCPYSPIYNYKDLKESHKHLDDETNCEFWLEKQGEPQPYRGNADTMRKNLIKAFKSVGSKHWGGFDVRDIIRFLESKDAIELELKEKPTKDQVWDYCNKISHEWWQITMDKWETLTDEEKDKYNQFIGFNDFSDILMNITAGALFQLRDTGKLEYEEGSLLLKKPDDTPKPLEVINEKQGEQNPAWSDEDEKMLKRICDYFENEGYQAGADDFDRKVWGENISWLKSIKPQPHWKPTEEQMSCFKQAIDLFKMKVNDDLVLRNLVSLYNDLKKL